MDLGAYQEKARVIVLQYVLDHLDKSDKPVPFTIDDVYVVSFIKTLQNWKALVSTTLPDNKYYELTHDGNKRRTYLDVYIKLENMAIDDFDLLDGRITPAEA